MKMEERERESIQWCVEFLYSCPVLYVWIFYDYPFLLSNNFARSLFQMSGPTEMIGTMTKWPRHRKGIG